MEFSEWLFQEMPITMKRVGDWQNVDNDPNGRWDQRAIKTFTSPKGLEKIQRVFEQSLYNFNVYMVRRQPNQSYPRDVYRVPINRAQQFYHNINVAPEEAPLDPNKVNLFLVAWQDDPPSAWMIAHRFAHTANTDYLEPAREAANQFIGAASGSSEQLLALQSVLTMRSARNGKVATVDEGLREVFAQYIMTGRVTLQPRNQWSRYVKDLEGLQAALTAACKAIMDEVAQYIHVM